MFCEVRVSAHSSVAESELESPEPSAIINKGFVDDNLRSRLRHLGDNLVRDANSEKVETLGRALNPDPLFKVFLRSELGFGGLLDSAIDEGFASFAADSGLGKADLGLAFETKMLLLRIGQRVAASCVAAGPLRNDGLENLEGGCGQVEVEQGLVRIVGVEFVDRSPMSSVL